MAYAASPAIPPGMNPDDWIGVAFAASAEAQRLTALIVAGGEVPKDVLTRATMMRAVAGRLHGVSQDAAMVADYVFATSLGPQMALSEQALRNALGSHAAATGDSLALWLGNHGYNPVVNTSALQAIAARTTQNMTHDWQRLTPMARERIAHAVSRGMVAGLNPQQVARGVAAAVQGEVSNAYARGMVIARTEMADCYDASSMDLLRGTEGVHGYRFDALDDACPVCQVLHGIVFPVDEYPNRHHQCRCGIVPVMDDELGLDDQPVPHGDYLPGVRRPRRLVESQVPKSWRPLPDDLRLLLDQRDNPGWRKSWTVTKAQNVAVPPPNMTWAKKAVHKDGSAIYRIKYGKTTMQYRLGPDGELQWWDGNPGTASGRGWVPVKKQTAITDYARKRLQGIPEGNPKLWPPQHWKSTQQAQGGPKPSWAGKPQPKPPAAPPPAPPPYGPQAFDQVLADAKQRFADFAKATGNPKNDLTKSLNWHLFEKYMATGDKAHLQQLVQLKYLDPADVAKWEAAYDRATTVDPKVAAAWQKQVDAYDAAYVAWKKDLEDWYTANPDAPRWTPIGDSAKTWPSQQAANAWANQHVPAIDRSHPGFQHLQAYTGGVYADWNKALRQQAKDGTPLPRGYAAKFDAMDDAMVPAPEAFTVARGTGWKELVGFGGVPPGNPADLVGRVFQQPGYWSTSVGDKAAFGGELFLHITVPQGHPVAWAKPFSHFPRENEVIVQRGARYVVKRAEKKGGTWNVYVEIIPDDLPEEVARQGVLAA